MRPRKTMIEQQNVEPFLAASRKHATQLKQNLRVIRGRAAERETGAYLGFGEERAYRRIAASFGHTKR